MTSPQIILTLHGVGEKYCERCDHQYDTPSSACRCIAFHADLQSLERLPACLTAEAELNRLKGWGKGLKRNSDGSLNLNPGDKLYFAAQLSAARQSGISEGLRIAAGECLDYVSAADCVDAVLALIKG